MQADLDLLRLAARAAGLELGTWHEANDACFVQIADDDFIWWNPLLDDGDTLRLAVKLGIRFRIDRIGTGDKTAATVRAMAAPNLVIESDIVLHHQEMEAVRRLVTMVAAEIGKAMP